MSESGGPFSSSRVSGRQRYDPVADVGMEDDDDGIDSSDLTSDEGDSKRRRPRKRKSEPGEDDNLPYGRRFESAGLNSLSTLSGRPCDEGITTDSLSTMVGAVGAKGTWD